MAPSTAKSKRHYRPHQKSAINLRIGAVLELYRLERDLSASDVARRAGFSTQQLINIERGIRDLRLTTLERTCRALGISVTEVLTIAEKE
jgi:transcriptional regulator with XRE-family HTH domain